MSERILGSRRQAGEASKARSPGYLFVSGGVFRNRGSPLPKHVGVAEPGSANPNPFSRVERNGYEYRIDDEKRTRSVSGTLTLSNTQARSRREQAAAGLPDRRPQDDGGHYIAARFNGPTDAFNHFAQDANLNRGAYRVMEDQWARAKRNGKSVVVRIDPAYVGSSRRPSAINVWFWINGERKSLNFRNGPKEARRDK